MDSRALGVVGNGEDIIGLSVAGDPPGVLVGAADPVAPDVFRVLVGFSIDHRIFQTQILAGVHYADCDLTPVGDENLSLQTVTHIVLML